MKKRKTSVWSRKLGKNRLVAVTLYGAEPKSVTFKGKKLTRARRSVS